MHYLPNIYKAIMVGWLAHQGANSWPGFEPTLCCCWQHRTLVLINLFWDMVDPIQTQLPKPNGVTVLVSTISQNGFPLGHDTPQRWALLFELICFNFLPPVSCWATVTITSCVWFDYRLLGCVFVVRWYASIRIQQPEAKNLCLPSRHSEGRR